MPMMGSECADRERGAVRPDGAVRSAVDGVFAALFAARVPLSPPPDEAGRIRPAAPPASTPVPAPAWEYAEDAAPALAGR